MTPTPTCPACDQPMLDHPICALPRCAALLHKGAWCPWDMQICKACDAALFKRGARRCRECGKIKPLEKFQQSPGTYYRDCRSCRGKRPKQREHARRTRERYAERYAAAQRERYHADPETHRARKRLSYQKHRDKRLARAAQWHREHREQRNAQSRAYHAASRAAANAKRRARYQRRKLAAWFGPAARGAL